MSGTMSTMKNTNNHNEKGMPRPRDSALIVDWNSIPVGERRIEQEVVCHLPRVMPKVGGKPLTNQFIMEMFDEKGIGDVSKCDWKGPYEHKRADGSVVHVYWELFVYFKEWYDTDEASKFQQHLLMPEKTQLWYDNENYWIVNRCWNPMSQRECAMRDEIRKLKCDMHDSNAWTQKTLMEQEGYFMEQLAVRDDYIAKLQRYIDENIDNKANGVYEDPLHDDVLPEEYDMMSECEKRCCERKNSISPPPSPTHSSASVDNTPDSVDMLQRTMSTTSGLSRAMSMV